MEKPKLGELLLKKGIISRSQLKIALEIQKQNDFKLGEALISLNFVTKTTLKRALVKQSWLKLLATVSTFLLAPIVPFNTCLAANSQSNHSIEVASLDKVNSVFTENLNASFTPISIDENAKNYYFSSHATNASGADVFFVLNSKLSRYSGLRFSLFSTPSLESEQNYPSFDPQISIFKFSFKPNLFSFNKQKRLSNNRYTNSIPAVFMLTLKGRSIYETAGNETKVWSLNSAKKGVQRKAQLMFSVTKHF